MLIPPRILCATSRCCSGFVSRMRYVNRLRESDEACTAALQSAVIFLFHCLDPLLQRTEHRTFRTVQHRTSDLLSLLHTLGADPCLVEESVLIGCSADKQAQFCLDVGALQQAAVEGACEGTFTDLRKSFFLLSAAEAPLVAKGRALLHWHQTNAFCGATGEPTRRNRAGSQRASSGGGVVLYPKMSPVVIVLVSDGTRCLLGRQASFPQGMYSALAGFCDMGESLEEALCREVAEEVGLEVQRISYSSSQHWPLPHSSFMLGCHASVSPAHTQLRVDHTELEDARWFSLDQISSALRVQTPPRRGHAPFWLPPTHAIARRLITEWADAQQRGQADL
ncbi:NAD(P)H pyrophosphatase NUDT13, mitochondrial isoform X3 [Genypterus blacodes]|uniref:NAD(P)H pyrophosphatase NUDT13, mitochondrial isoform X3 n=1 Tax=Genypterus blacodes TaxID=154954 RepID=UPI003F764905